MKTYVVADLAGRFDEFISLVAQFEQPCFVIQLGDICDRGKNSKELLEYLVVHKEMVCLKGNHESMMTDYHRGPHLYDKGCWLRNGGRETLKSFSGTIPEEVLLWAEELPERIEVEVEGKLYLITHAPTPTLGRRWPESPENLWNRNPPSSRSQVCPSDLRPQQPT